LFFSGKESIRLGIGPQNLPFDELAAATLTRDDLTNANAVNLSAGSRHQPQLFASAQPSHAARRPRVRY
jgi:hypothetical protein